MVRKKNEDLSRILDDLRKERHDLDSKLRHYTSMSDPTAQQFERGYRQAIDQQIRSLDMIIRRYDYLVS